MNNVLDGMRWDHLTEDVFDDPGDPGQIVKRFVNEAKNDTITELGGELQQKEFVFATNHAVTSENMTITLTGNSFGTTSLLASGNLFDDSWMVGAKIAMPETAFTAAVVSLTVPDEEDPPNRGWFRITTIAAPTLAAVDMDITQDTAINVTEYAIYRDEYTLDTTVRRVIKAWTSDGPLDLEFVDSRDEFETLYPGDVQIGVPRKMSIRRSNESGGIWMCRLWPAPAERVQIRYEAKWMLADLVEHDDTWDLEPELENIIADRALMKACQTPVQSDPDSASLLRRDTRERAMNWKHAFGNPDGGRVRRRRGPDEGGDIVIRRRGTT